METEILKAVVEMVKSGGQYACLGILTHIIIHSITTAVCSILDKRSARQARRTSKKRTIVFF